MNRELVGLRWKRRWVSYLGCLKGCLDYLGENVSWGWLYGGTAHAFLLNIHPELCPSGPTAWNHAMLPDLGRNLGYATHPVSSQTGLPEFEAQQVLAWETVRNALDAGKPCFGWELDMAEYYVVYGYDERGYLYRGPGAEEGRGPKPWQELGRSRIGTLDVAVIEVGRAADDQLVIREALQTAVRFANSPEDWVHPDYRAGIGGYAVWIDALKDGRADRFGQGYNAAVWAECRREAVAFLEEARRRLPQHRHELLDRAVAEYHIVADRLTRLSALTPMTSPDRQGEPMRSLKGAEILRQAMQAEAQGLNTLRELAQAL